MTEEMKRDFELLADQAENDLASAHAEICKLQNLDPATHNWPSWTPQANTLRWIKELRQKHGLSAHGNTQKRP